LTGDVAAHILIDTERDPARRSDDLLPVETVAIFFVATFLLLATPLASERVKRKIARLKKSHDGS
jgi:hypothetical protein